MSSSAASPISCFLAMARSKRSGDVEVYSDAGNRRGVGSWGCYAKRKDGRGGEFERAGLLKGSLDNSELCEIRAIANSLHSLVKSGMIDRGEFVVVRCDNVGAGNRINAPANRDKRQNIVELNRCAQWIRDFASRNGFTLSVRFVKGHQPETSKDVHAFGNRRADALASSFFKDKYKIPKARPTISSAARAAKLAATVAKLTTGKVSA
jgi:hypothetical protein